MKTRDSMSSLLNSSLEWIKNEFIKCIEGLFTFTIFFYSGSCYVFHLSLKCLCVHN